MYFSILQRVDLCRAAHLLRRKRPLHIVKYGQGRKKTDALGIGSFFDSESGVLIRLLKAA
jgi:hypothetical protein